MSDPIYPPKPNIQSQAHVRSLEDYQRLYDLSIEKPQHFWAEQLKTLSLFRPFDRVFHEDFDLANVRWFEGAQLNVCHNCVDRHLPDRADQVAIIWAKDEPGEYERITYQQLHEHVCRVANVLRDHGVGRGDRVCIYLPMIPELAYTMLACARIGAVHSVVFAGFSADSLRDRILDADCRVVVTANEGLRGSKKIPLKATVDAACEGTRVDCVLVARRTDAEVAMVAGRDRWLEAEVERQRPYCPVEVMDAEDPLFILYTSGSTGKPKGVMHTSAGYLLYSAFTHRMVFDYHDGDIYFCAADIGWVTGHSYIIYGPLCNAATTVMFESVPLYPDAGRYWQIVDDLQVNIFYTAPTALRAIARLGDEWVTKYKRDSLRVLGSVGEPINPEVWQWYHDRRRRTDVARLSTPGGRRRPGGIHHLAPSRSATPTKPGSATLPLFGDRAAPGRRESARRSRATA